MTFTVFVIIYNAAVQLTGFYAEEVYAVESGMLLFFYICLVTKHFKFWFIKKHFF
jgi:hypothetical protein